MTFKEKIVKLRKLKGLTQDEFASAVGVSRQAVYKWESGQSYPEVSKLLEIKLLFNISIDDLLDESYEVIVPEKKKRKRISKEAKVEIEKAAIAPAFEESAPVQEVKEEAAAPEIIAEPAIEPQPALSYAKASDDPISAPAPSYATVPASTPAQESAPEEEQPKKKVGFFGRLFGRK